MTDCKNCNYTDEYCASGECTSQSPRNGSQKGDLTSQWKKGELKPGLYYGADYAGFTHFYMFDAWTMRYLTGMPATNIKEIVATVPSYDELQNMNKAVNECMSANIKLVEQNTQLKDKIERLEKQYGRAKWWLNKIVKNHRFTPISTAEKALKDLSELEK